MTALITGAAGFVGRRLAERLVAAGENPVLVDNHRIDDGPLAGAQWVVGDIADGALMDRALAAGVDVIFHLAAVPGGAAEADPAASKRVNLEATLALAERAAALAAPPRFVYSSSIAVLGQPQGPVSDETPCAPLITYGAHKQMVEIALRDGSRRAALSCASIRLPGVVARPPGGAGLKSAFMSELFHALSDGAPCTVPVSPAATVWIVSAECAVDALLQAAEPATIHHLAGRPVTIPVLHCSIGDLVDEIARHTGASSALVTYEPDELTERVFGRQPSLETPLALAAGFNPAETLPDLVASVLGRLAPSENKAILTLN